jgi:endonuclease I
LEVKVDSQDLTQALRELARATSQEYYDKAADEADRRAYYGNIPDSLTPAERFRYLHELIERTHTPRLSYKPAKYVYPWVDLHQDLKLRNIYSGKPSDPEQLILEDFRIDLERAARLRETLVDRVVKGSISIANQLTMIEAALPYNCEHVVPQSWFDEDAQPMKGDLHHLFTCEPECNSFRGNIPYYDFIDYREVVRSDCGKREDNKFEPNTNKGIVARATLYFLLRYPGEIDDEKNEYEPDRLEILMNWHNSEDVTLYEKHRNMAIFEKQGNRNPLIDFPKWANRIDFGLGLGNSERRKKLKSIAFTY